MERQKYYNYILGKLSTLAYRIQLSGKLNVLDLHIHAENFYRDLLNTIYGWNLVNLNELSQNQEAIDLADSVNKLLVQVSATNTKKKLDASLAKIDISKYKDYTFKFVSIAKPADNLRKHIYTTPDDIFFNPESDIYDVQALLAKIHNMEIEQYEQIYDYIRKELGKELETESIDSDLTKVILILSQSNLSNPGPIRIDNEFEILRKIEYNRLTSESRRIIQEYGAFQQKVEDIYQAYDREGMNRSTFVLNKIRRIYTTLMDELEGDVLFNKMRECVKREIYGSPNRDDLTQEAIEFCSDILIVDAFIRCKIFENPEGYQDVTA